LGKIDALDKAGRSCAEFTKEKGKKSITVKAVGTIGGAVATVGTGIAVGATFGQIKAVNKACVDCAEFTGDVAVDTAKNAGEAVVDIADGIPVVGHVKGGIHYAVGDREGGDKAMKAASRTVGVIGGGILGMAGGPAGAIAGGVAGGAVMDGVITGTDSLVHGEFRPSG